MLKKLIFLITLLLSLSSTVLAEEIYDPWENTNRAVFNLNDKLDIYLLEPVARTYGKITPSPLQKGVTSFFENLRYPRYLVSDLIQFKFGQALSHTGRFLINSTIGLAGIIDVAEDMGLEEHYEDFATALAYYEVPAGPYMVVPFIGSSNIRDFSGSVVDRLLNPIYWLGEFDEIDDTDAMRISIGTTILEVINMRYNYTEAINSAKESSLDYYSFMQSSYYQYREGLVYDGQKPTTGLNVDAWDEDEPNWNEEE